MRETLRGESEKAKPKLLERVRQCLRAKFYAIRTEQTYVDWIRRFILFHGKRHPDKMREEEIRAFLSHLAIERDVAAATQNQAISDLLFLHEQVLERPLDDLGAMKRA